MYNADVNANAGIIFIIIITKIGKKLQSIQNNCFIIIFMVSLW